jgi:hypothetical protein
LFAGNRCPRQHSGGDGVDELDARERHSVHAHWRNQILSTEQSLQLVVTKDSNQQPTTQTL